MHNNRMPVRELQATLLLGVQLRIHPACRSSKAKRFARKALS